MCCAVARGLVTVMPKEVYETPRMIHVFPVVRTCLLTGCAVGLAVIVGVCRVIAETDARASGVSHPAW